MPKLHCFALI